MEHKSSLASTSASDLLLPSSSPRSHRTLRRLQSSHAIGSAASASSRIPSHTLISPQYLQTQHGQAVSSKALTPAVSSSPAFRGRSNSDAVNSVAATTMLASTRHAPGRKLVAPEAPPLDKLVRDGPANSNLSVALESMRLKILDQGVKSDGDGMSSLRIYVWLILLNAPIIDTDSYLSLIHRGASPAYSKIRNDTFRTLATDPLFRRRVSEASLIRLLNAIAWKLHDTKEEERLKELNAINDRDRIATVTHQPDRRAETRSAPATSRPRARATTLTTEGSDASSSEAGTYVQGMNVLAAPFLYAARSEAEAFASFHRFITRECPGYVRGAMDGVHRGLALVDKVLAIVDPKLSIYLIGKGMHAELYAFPSVLTLCACTPPLPEVLRLWDFLFAYGAHLNILCIVAQLVILRNTILNSPSPTKILRSLPPLHAETIKAYTLTLIKKIPDDIYAEIIDHAK